MIRGIDRGQIIIKAFHAYTKAKQHGLTCIGFLIGPSSKLAGPKELRRLPRPGKLGLLLRRCSILEDKGSRVVRRRFIAGLAQSACMRQ